MFFSKQIHQLSSWFTSSKRSVVAQSPVRGEAARACKASACKPSRGTRRRHLLESMEPRYLMAADPLWVGGVYVESDIGGDEHGDLFYVTFGGGAPGTTLNRLIINSDLSATGFNQGDLIFDTVKGGFGSDNAIPFELKELRTADPNASVKATIQDGQSILTLDFTNFKAGDMLVFSIDVDEVNYLDPTVTDLDEINSNVDPITSGIEFQNSILKAEFSAPHYENVSGQDKFLNLYDSKLTPSRLPLPVDNHEGLRDRTAGAVASLQQVPKPISLAGTVFVDANEDLNIQSSEDRLADVKLELFKLVGGSYVSTGFTTTTNAQGKYEFGTALKLQPGTYQVRETQPTGYFSVGAKPGKLDGISTVGKNVVGDPDVLTEITILLGDQHATELNFGEILPSSLGGKVCVSEGGLSCFDSGATEKPLAGVTVELRDATGKIIATQLTAADGSYSFAGLRPGLYSITELTPLGLIDGEAVSGSIGGQIANPSEIRQINLQGGVNGTNYDFCELVPSELSGHTYLDQNNNGVRDLGETPLVDVLVSLFDEQGNKVAETRTDAKGFYQFTNLKPGIYRVTEVTPAGYIPGQAAVGTVNGSATGVNDSTGDVLAQIRLPSGRKGINYDFGEILPGSISGHVMADTNGNCIVDATGDRDLEGVTIELLDAAGNVLKTTKTDAQGRYLFDGLLPATYGIREIQPTGYLQGDHSAGSGGGDDSQPDLITQIIVTSGSRLVDYDFCEVPPAEISGSVYVDANQDCVRDPSEAPIAGVLISLIDQDGNVIATTLTNSDGRYSFKGLKPGSYSVREQQPADYMQGGQKAGSGGGNDSVADVISAITIGAGDSLVDYDFCEILPGSLSGVVFTDLNFDCIQDPDEAPISNVLIELLDEAGQVIASTRTDSQGQYSFTNLRPGTYSVREIQPSGYFHGGQMAPATGGNDSLEDLISAIVVGSGQAVRNADFCEVPPAKISGYVYQDGPVIETQTGELPSDIRTIRDGNRTADDTPIAGVTLQLRFVNGLPVTTDRTLTGIYSGEFVEVVTDANGYFEFDGLRSAPYHVYQLQPTDYIDSLDTPGTTGGFGVNRNEVVPEFVTLMLLDVPLTSPNFDAILLIEALPAQVSVNNNFSEVLVNKLPPAVPPLPPQPPILNVPVPTPELYQGQPALTATVPTWSPLPLLVGVGHEAPPTWHLSVINGGFPRGNRSGKPVQVEEIAANAQRLNVYAWTVRGLKESTWKIVSTKPSPNMLTSRNVFDLPGAKPLAGDFNGDGFDEVVLFVDGEWFIDLNGNGRWDEEDIWLKLGTVGDQPVVGDWDGDGKDDVGIFGKKWSGDERALASETGLPDPENTHRVKPKNLPPTADEAPDDQRLLKRSHQADGRADLIDHVFLFGKEQDIAISGDFNGDGISTIGIFRDGDWILDVDGDGRLNPETDSQLELGQAGDLPLVGDFDGDGVDELAYVRGDRVYVDSNSNGHIDATDQVFQLESSEGNVIVGDFDGDGRDEPALHQSAERSRTLEARRAG